MTKKLSHSCVTVVMDQLSVTRKIANVVLPVRMAGKSHAHWSRPVPLAAPTDPLQRGQLGGGSVTKFVGERYFTKG